MPHFYAGESSGKKWGIVMDKKELEKTRSDLQRELEEGAVRLSKLEAEARQLQNDQTRLQAVVVALENLLSGADPETMQLTEAILTMARQRPGLPAVNLAVKVSRMVPSKSADPQRVAAVRIAQLVKEERLREENGAIHIGPKA